MQRHVVGEAELSANGRPVQLEPGARYVGTNAGIESGFLQHAKLVRAAAKPGEISSVCVCVCELIRREIAYYRALLSSSCRTARAASRTAGARSTRPVITAAVVSR